MINSEIKEIGRILEEVVRKKFTSNVHFADSCNISETTVRRIFKGEQNLSLITLKKICDVLELKVSDLLIKAGL